MPILANIGGGLALDRRSGQSSAAAGILGHMGCPAGSRKVTWPVVVSTWTVNLAVAIFVRLPPSWW